MVRWLLQNEKKYVRKNIRSRDDTTKWAMQSRWKITNNNYTLTPYFNGLIFEGINKGITFPFNKVWDNYNLLKIKLFTCILYLITSINQIIIYVLYIFWYYSVDVNFLYILVVTSNLKMDYIIKSLKYQVLLSHCLKYTI